MGKSRRWEKLGLGLWQNIKLSQAQDTGDERVHKVGASDWSLSRTCGIDVQIWTWKKQKKYSTRRSGRMTILKYLCNSSLFLFSKSN
jgi:hypothetical protein